MTELCRIRIHMSSCSSLHKIPCTGKTRKKGFRLVLFLLMVWRSIQSYKPLKLCCLDIDLPVRAELNAAWSLLFSFAFFLTQKLLLAGCQAEQKKNGQRERGHFKPFPFRLLSAHSHLPWAVFFSLHGVKKCGNHVSFFLPLVENSWGRCDLEQNKTDRKGRS